MFTRTPARRVLRRTATLLLAALVPVAVLLTPTTGTAAADGPRTGNASPSGLLPMPPGFHGYHSIRAVRSELRGHYLGPSEATHWRRLRITGWVYTRRCNGGNPHAGWAALYSVRQFADPDGPPTGGYDMPVGTVRHVDPSTWCEVAPADLCDWMTICFWDTDSNVLNYDIGDAFAWLTGGRSLGDDITACAIGAAKAAGINGFFKQRLTQGLLAGGKLTLGESWVVLAATGCLYTALFPR